jgi:hypothetical protein
LLLLEVAVVAELESLQPPVRVVASSPLLEKMARDKVVEAVHKLPEDTGEQLTDLELRGQLARYLLVEMEGRAISTVEAVEVVATSAEVVAVPILTAQVMMRELVEVDPLLQIRSTQQTSRTLRESKAAMEW